MNIEVLQQYLKNIREFFSQKLAEMQMLQDRQASEIEALTNKIMALGIIVALLIIVIIILAIILKSSRKRRKRRELEEREEEIKREERRLREERRKFAEQHEQQVRRAQAWPERSGKPATVWPEKPDNTASVEYGQPSRRKYPGRQDDKAMRDEANRETQYFNDQEEWR